MQFAGAPAGTQSSHCAQPLPHTGVCFHTDTQRTALQENLPGKQLARGSSALGGSLGVRRAKKVTTKSRTGDLLGLPSHTY